MHASELLHCRESAHGSLHQTQSAAKIVRFTALLDTLAKRQANT